MPLVSVVVPVYNAEKYLHRCVDSILAQSYAKFELILVDDGSLDNSGTICDEYAAKDSRIRAIHKKNGGVSSARNTGLNAARGKYISFVDSDDWISVDFLENAMSVCEEKHLDIYMGGFSWVGDSGVQKSVCIPHTIDAALRALTESEYIQLLSNSYISSAWGNVIRRSFIGSLRFEDNMSFGEDLCFVFELLKKSPRCYATTAPVYFYWNTEGSLTKQCGEAKLQNVVQTYQTLLDFAEFNAYSTFLSSVKQRWIKDLLYLQRIILNESKTLIEKYKLLVVLLHDNRLTSIVRQSNDLYCRRYATYPALQICYHAYLEFRRKICNKL